MSDSGPHLWRDLPREGRLLLSVVVLEFLGSGLVLPFNVVYLHEVRGFALSQVGLLLGVTPLLALLVVGPGGAAIDRYGARRVQLAALVTMAGGNALLAVASTPAVAAVALGLYGAAFGVAWPAWQSVVASVVPAPLRPRYFGVNFTLLNVGVGLGGVLAGLLVDVDRPGTFEAVYLANAASYLPAVVLLLGPLRHVAGRVATPGPEDGASPAGYLTVLRDPAMAAVTVLAFASQLFGYAQLGSGLPAYARVVSEVSTRALGFAFAANTLVIVLVQLLVLRHLDGRRRTRVVALMGLTWAVAWVLLGLSGTVPGTLGATVLVAACASVFALGETLLQPTVPPLVNDLAPDHLRGRYNAVSSGAFALAAVVAPPVTGLLLGADLGVVYVVLLVLGCLVVALLAVGHLEPRLTPAVNGVRGAGAAGPPAPRRRRAPASSSP